MDKEKPSKHGVKIKASQMLTKWLREIAVEVTESIKDPLSGETVMATKAEALARKIWERALGYKSLDIKKGSISETTHQPDRGMMILIFERLEGKVPITTEVGKKKVTAAERMSMESAKRLNNLVGFNATANTNRET